MRISRLRLLPVVGAIAALGACAVVPTGPSVMALPGAGKSFEQFRQEDAYCREYAASQIGGANYQNSAMDSTARSAALGTVVGAVAGAAIGGSRGAGVGAGTGLLAGTMAGAGAGQQSGYIAQRRLDNAYVQCMYASGNRVPVRGQFTYATPGYPPPPPRGYPPPPPPPR